MPIPILLAFKSVQPERVPTISKAAPRDDCVMGEPGIRMAGSDLRDHSGRSKLELRPADEKDLLASDTAVLRAVKGAGRVVTAVFVLVPIVAAVVTEIWLAELFDDHLIAMMLTLTASIVVITLALPSFVRRR